MVFDLLCISSFLVNNFIRCCWWCCYRGIHRCLIAGLSQSCTTNVFLHILCIRTNKQTKKAAHRTHVFVESDHFCSQRVRHHRPGGESLLQKRAENVLVHAKRFKIQPALCDSESLWGCRKKPYNRWFVYVSRSYKWPGLLCCL